ncbi:ATP-dependent DNA helicase PcrA [Candidatus Kaiserbacteria bacterium]|nr:ATP-dependent DNA helicase PcrA [Candidatus Kaiserbacteria bacterium]
MKHLQGLNPEQQEAVLAIDGPLLVLAGAGAGKTRVIAERIQEIIRRGAEPASILAITFTNKAAGEMRSRIGPGPFVSTFHSLGLTLIKENVKLLGYKRTPSIYDRADSLSEMKRALKAVGAEDLEPRLALAVASRQKGEGVGAAEFAASAVLPRDRDIAKAWLRYEAALREDNAVDFDDLLVKAVELLEQHPEVRTACQQRWRYVHIDEYQDTNAIQATLADLLVGPEKNICAVGDVDQTIYGWRGAQIENILSFERKYTGAKVVLLEQNYRSTKAILSAANELIANNPNRPEKNLHTKNADGQPVAVYAAGDGADEARFVVRKIQSLITDGARPADCAVLYRANFQSRAIEEKLLDAGVPYQVLGTRFFDRKEVKDVLSFVRAALQGSMADLGRVIDTIPGLGKVTKFKILSGQEAALQGKTLERVQNMRTLLAAIAAQAAQLPPSALLRLVITESGIEKNLKEDKFEGGERLENLAELVSLATRYDGLGADGLEKFLEAAALASDQDELKEERNMVRLMTVHAAKGLEFPYVFIIGLEEGLFPYEREGEKDTLEEERRLMYVALTRGQRRVYLSFAMMRTVFGSTDIRSPSMFLEEIKDHLQSEEPESLGKTIYLD